MTTTIFFRRNYSFLDLEIQRSQYIRPKVTVHKCAETIQGRKLYEEIRCTDCNCINFVRPTFTGFPWEPSLYFSSINKAKQPRQIFP